MPFSSKTDLNDKKRQINTYPIYICAKTTKQRKHNKKQGHNPGFRILSLLGDMERRQASQTGV